MKRAIINLEIDGHKINLDIQYDLEPSTRPLDNVRIDHMQTETPQVANVGEGNLKFREKEAKRIDLKRTVPGTGISIVEPAPLVPHIDKEKYGPRKARKRRKAKQDPFELVKHGYIVRGPYEKKGGKVAPSLVLYHPQEPRKKVEYAVGTQVDDETVKRLKAAAADNEKYARHRGGQFKEPVAEVTHPTGKLPPKEIPKFCSICRNDGRVLGVCMTNQDPHCRECCDRGNHQVE